MKRFQIRWPDEWLRRTRLFRTDLLSYSGKDFIVSVSLYLISVGFCLVLRNFDPNNDTSYVSMIFLLDVFLTALLTDGSPASSFFLPTNKKQGAAAPCL